MEQTRLPPQDIEAEKAVLGSVMIDPETIIRVEEILTARDFYREANGLIFTAALDVHRSGSSCDLLTVSDELRRQKLLIEVGDMAYLASLHSAAITSVHAEHYARIVARCAQMRGLISVGNTISALGYDDALDPNEALDRSERQLFNLHQRKAGGFVSLKEIVNDLWHDLTAQKDGRPTSGLMTGFDKLDEYTSGMKRGNLILIAGQTSSGKTTLGMNIALSLAKRGVPIGIFSLEMSCEELGKRFAAMQANVAIKNIEAHALIDREWENLTDAFGGLTEAAIHVDETSGLNILELRARARREQMRHNIGLFIVDYLQLIDGLSKRNRVEEITEVSRSLKVLAREIDAPIIALSQMNRAVDYREDRTPKLSDLRDSGSLEQDADIVLFVYADEQDSEMGQVMIRVAKNRNGPTGKFLLRFNPETFTFANAE